MNCPQCGAENANTSNFCTSCGAPLAATGNATATPSASSEAPGETRAYPGFPAGDASAGAGFAANGAPGEQAPQSNQYMPPNPAQAFSYQNAYQQQVTPEAAYSMTSTDEALRLANFVLCVISCVLGAAAIIPLAWTIPMTVHSWGIYKGKQPNTIAFGVCTLIFVNLIGGVLLLVSNKDK